MLSHVKSFGLNGIEAHLVEVEVDMSSGLPAFEIVGLPDAAVRESKDRVRAAMRNSGLTLPNMRIVVNLAPAGERKEGTVYDLPLAVGMLAAMGEIGALALSDAAFFGELSLDGEVKPVSGALSMALDASRFGVKRLFASVENAEEMCCVQDISVFPVKTLAQLVAFLRGQNDIAPAVFGGFINARQKYNIGFEDVIGQQTAKRAAEIAAAGGHNLFLIGPPGGGKTMLASAIVSILPDLSFEEAVEVTRVYSLAGERSGLARERPFRAPHHSASLVALTGGGTQALPGEISMAHRGILFLDEIAEFKRSALESLRQPLESGFVTVARANRTATYPARFMLVAAMNPCPCGNFLSRNKECACTAAQRRRYLNKISGPLLDRFDLFVEMSEVQPDELVERIGETSQEIGKRVNAARTIQRQRLHDEEISCNAQLDARRLKAHVKLTPAAKSLIEKAFAVKRLGMRAHNRILKVARTIADLDASEFVEERHVGEALQYREQIGRYW